MLHLLYFMSLWPELCELDRYIVSLFCVTVYALSRELKMGPKPEPKHAFPAPPPQRKTKSTSSANVCGGEAGGSCLEEPMSEGVILGKVMWQGHTTTPFHLGGCGPSVSLEHMPWALSQVLVERPLSTEAMGLFFQPKL